MEGFTSPGIRDKVHKAPIEVVTLERFALISETMKV